MKNKYLILLLIIIFLFILSCNNTQKNTKIITTIYPYYLIVKEITGDSVKVENLLPPAASPHTYSPKPSDLMKFENAGLIIVNGYHLESHLNDKLRGYDSAFFISDSMKNILGDNVNPHIWLDPVLLKKIVPYIKEEIIKLDPKKKDYYENNTRQLLEELSKINSKIQEQSKDIQNKNVIMYHKGFDYLLKRYKVNILAYIEEIPGKELGAKKMQEIGNLIKKYKLTTLYSEPQLNSKPLRVLSGEFKLHILILDPLGTTLKINSICDLIEYNWEQIVKGFSNDTSKESNI